MSAQRRGITPESSGTIVAAQHNLARQQRPERSAQRGSRVACHSRLSN
jgi:hypothetical protein